MVYCPPARSVDWWEVCARTDNGHGPLECAKPFLVRGPIPHFLLPSLISPVLISEANIST